MATRICLFANTTWYLYNFRRALIEAIQSNGHEVIALAPRDEYVDRLPCALHHIPLAHHGLNPIKDLLFYRRVRRTLAHLRPDLLLNYTIKPNIYGTLAAHALGIPTINNVTGLGTVFIDENWISLIARQLYRMSQPKAGVVFFQNEQDREVFIAKRLITRDKARRIAGSGIDTAHFAPTEGCADASRFRFLLIGRLLGDKGVREFVEAARKLREEYPRAEFQLLGRVGVPNRTAISSTELQGWVAHGAITYLGAVDDVRPVIAQSNCVVLPSYREGLSRTLLEAASMAKPIVTTDVPGCRDVVDDGLTGFLCKPRDEVSLADAMERAMNLECSQLQAMGLAGRQKVIREFGQKLVLDHYLAAIESLIADRRVKADDRTRLSESKTVSGD